MASKINFILNDEELNITCSAGKTLLDYIRNEAKLKGTKEGCREGDCGACTVLLGELIDDELHYKSINSCLYPIGKVQSKHVVTIEGLNTNKLTPIQESYTEKNASQCGYCTPGFIISSTGYIVEKDNYGMTAAIDAIAGNICRCTGYISIIRALKEIIEKVPTINSTDKISYLVGDGYLPDYFNSIEERLKTLSGVGSSQEIESKIVVSGGTDLYVQREDDLKEIDPILIKQNSHENIWIEHDFIYVNGSTTFEEFANSEIIQKEIPSIQYANKLIASLPIRNSASLAGNIVNASPIGDMTIILLALNATLILEENNQIRELPLKEFFLGYKELNKKPYELIGIIKFPLSHKNILFNFEKVSKRTHLDIATVNSAIKLKIGGSFINSCELSFGGVAPVPLYMKETSKYLEENELEVNTIHEAIRIMESEISPISDIRGNSDYKKLLSKQILKSHFIQLFPKLFSMDKLR